MSRTHIATILSVTMVLAAIGTNAARAQACGDTLTATTVLSSNLSCAGPGLDIGADGIVLDCANFTITGSGSNVGIRLAGRTGVFVRNCLVSNFGTGFLLSGSTSNVLRLNGALDNTSVGSGGFYLSNSSGNALQQNRSSGNTGRGFVLSGSGGNFVVNNSAFANNFRGFDLTNSSNGNFVVLNNATDNQSGGFVVSAGSSANVLVGNDALLNSSEGFAMFSPGNALAGNDGSENGTFGFTDTTGTGGNVYGSNFCDFNVSGGASPTGLCAPQP